MRVLTFLGAAGLVLIALMFVADATLPKGSPAIVTTQQIGLPESRQPRDEIKILTNAPALAPDMTSQAVLVAQLRQISEVPRKIEPAASAAWAQTPIQNNSFTRATGYRQNQLADRLSIGGQ
jgi:hypothetical protein